MVIFGVGVGEWRIRISGVKEVCLVRLRVGVDDGGRFLGRGIRLEGM